MYIVTSKVKKKVKELGFRMSPDFLAGLELAVDVIITKSTEWAKPKKTLTRDDVIAYLTNCKVKV